MKQGTCCQILQALTADPQLLCHADTHVCHTLRMFVRHMYQFCLHAVQSIRTG